MKQMVEIHMKHLGYALRFHNEHHPHDQIVLQDVMKDVIAFGTERPKGRSAAQNHFLCLLTLGTTIERHKTSARGDGNLAKVGILSDIQMSILQTFDIPQGILIGLGYYVSIAEEGARYTEMERRHACHSSLKDFTTTLTETQGGTGGDLQNLMVGISHLLSMMDGYQKRLTYGTMKNHHGCKKDQQKDKVHKVGPLLRRDRNRKHRHNQEL